ncbi:MAG: hypothetical protein MK033_10390 [Candidatus Caenarcaniphilales bacterium]|nr:hypothetical protein [Candidatus Caenarcaniphilales bacterium]
MVFVAKSIEEYAAEQDKSEILKARAKAQKLLAELKELIQPGMSEFEAQALAK